MIEEKRTNWLLRQFVDGIEERLISDRAYSYTSAVIDMRERLVPYDVMKRVLHRVSGHQPRSDEVSA